MFWYVRRLIPAWAGKTGPPRRPRGRHPAHPRVGGENLSESHTAGLVHGSSPRGRGKPTGTRTMSAWVRLIPAWAGKTLVELIVHFARGAHPRVGGENLLRESKHRNDLGSSPRGRGKRKEPWYATPADGLIPAWAGKTCIGYGSRPWFRGSSPRGRGKPAQTTTARRSQGLIPAWAGKTPEQPPTRPVPTAHPRVGGENEDFYSESERRRGSSPRGRGKRSGSGLRGWSVVAHPRVGGENELSHDLDHRGVGSSPRGRGKHPLSVTPHIAFRLIPAWAGKTWRPQGGYEDPEAHPRVGGENAKSRGTPPRLTGSSPRGRGKPRRPCSYLLARRLIPAWAGKTGCAARRCSRCRAHPRVGGENEDPFLKAAAGVGSSPRGRGKHFLTCAFIERIGQILETLELAVSSESYTLSAAYATDAPQDQARNTALVLPSSRGAS